MRRKCFLIIVFLAILILVLSGLKCKTDVIAACNDGKDNDQDGLIDVQDPGCTSSKDNNEYNAPKMEESGSFGLAGLYTLNDFNKTNQLGVTISRPEVSWDWLEKSDDHFDFSTIDKTYDELKKYNLEPIISLRAKQGWGTGCDTAHIKCPQYYKTCPHKFASCPPKDLGEWGQYGYSQFYYDFVYKTLEHLFTTNRPIGFIIVENEVNTLTFWHGTAEDYLKTRATVYKAVKDFNSDYGTDIKVVDSGIASTVWGNAVIYETYCKGKTNKALEFAKKYYRRIRTVTENDLNILDCKNPLNNEEGRGYLILKEIFKKEPELGQPRFDYISYHFYEPWDTQEEIINWIKTEMQKNDYQRPIIMTEGGFVDKINNDEQEVANDLIKNHVIAFANGVEKYIWLPLVENFESNALGSEYKGLYSSGEYPLPASAAYKLLIEKIGGFTDLEKLDIAEYAYKFTVNNKPVYVLWSDTSKTIDFSSQMTPSIKVTKVDGSFEIRPSLSLRLTPSPVFVEAR